MDLVDVDGHTALHWAALGGNAEICQILMENGISPNVQVKHSGLVCLFTGLVFLYE